MRNVIYLVFAFLILGCGNEDELTSKIEIENLYGIQDDPSDPVNTGYPFILMTRSGEFS